MADLIYRGSIVPLDKITLVTPLTDKTSCGTMYMDSCEGTAKDCESCLFSSQSNPLPEKYAMWFRGNSKSRKVAREMNL